MGSNAGAVQIYTDNGFDRLHTSTIYPPEASGAAQFGSSVAIDSGRLIVGAPFAEAGRGRAYIYEQAGSGWSLQDVVQSPTPAAGDYFG